MVCGGAHRCVSATASVDVQTSAAAAVCIDEVSEAGAPPDSEETLGTEGEGMKCELASARIESVRSVVGSIRCIVDRGQEAGAGGWTVQELGTPAVHGAMKAVTVKAAVKGRQKGAVVV